MPAPAPLSYHTPSATPPRDRRVLPAQVVCLYLILSLLTLPFINAFWIGELSPLVAFQLPKIAVHRLVMDHVAVPAVYSLGLARSASPAHILATPYALAVTYLLPLLPVLTFTHLTHAPNRRHWSALLLTLALLDYIVTLAASRITGLSIL